MKTELRVSAEVRCANRRWGPLPSAARAALRQLVREYGFSARVGDLYFVDGGWLVSHSGLLRIARRNQCVGISVNPLSEFCDSRKARWVFRAVVFKSRACKGFVGLGDADPANVSPFLRGAEMRIAETRAVNRALRKAYGIGLCSVEEIGLPRSGAAEHKLDRIPPQPSNGTGSTNHPKLRDRLCQIIRQYHLDPALVKLYAAEFCGVQELRAATRELVEDFVNHVAELAATDGAGLLSKLNGYAENQEGAA